ncbi:MAG: Serine--tRNA ligase [Fimbriimonadaceae bacterium]|nr:Serine--tRNA ligase [Fimbriimonadaceae bacterium]
MLDRQLLREQPEFVRQQCLRKGIEAPIDEFTRIDAEWRTQKHALDEMLARSNAISKTIGHLMAQGKREEAEAAKGETAALKAQIQALEQQVRDLEAALSEIELKFPNLPHESVPDGADPEDNVVVRTFAEPPTFEWEAKPHWEIGEELGLIDLARGAKIAGSGFPVYTGWGARLQRALISFMIDHQTQNNGYREVFPPYIVNTASLVGTGNLPKFEEDLYKVDDGLYLIPTAEVPVTNLYRDEILEAWQLPINLAGYSACFRKEAGSAGKDTRGLLRIHQFDKIELVKFTLPESSYDELEQLTADAESVLQTLGLHYRVVLLCAGDMGDKGCKCYDLEVWSPGVGRYLEISSCTNFEAYQARRANIRFRREQGAKPEHVHILNGSGLATPRLFSAIVETHYHPDGYVDVPGPLRQYVGTDRIEAGTL